MTREQAIALAMSLVKVAGELLAAAAVMPAADTGTAAGSGQS